MKIYKPEKRLFSGRGEKHLTTRLVEKVFEQAVKRERHITRIMRKDIARIQSPRDRLLGERKNEKTKSFYRDTI